MNFDFIKKEYIERFYDTLDKLDEKNRCNKRFVFVMILDKDNNVLSQGQNHPLSNENEFFTCPKTFTYDEHKKFQAYAEVHAEIDAITNCNRTDSHTLVVNYPPCADCLKAIINVGIKNLIIFQVDNGKDDGRYKYEKLEHVNRVLRFFDQVILG